MELNINSPAYYTQKFGVNDDLYNMCKNIHLFLKDKNYSNKIQIVGLIPIIAPQQELAQGKWKENIKFDFKANLVIISKRIDYDAFVPADILKKKELMLKCIFDSIVDIKKKGKFDADTFKTDVIQFLDSYL